MYNLDDKELDRLSQTAADKYEAPGAPSWEAMERTLDIELPQQKKKKRRGLFFFILFAGFLAGTAIWYGLHKNETSFENKSTIKSGLTTTTENHNINNQSGEALAGNNQEAAVSIIDNSNNPEGASKPAANSTVSIVPATSDKSNIPAAGNNKSISSAALTLTKKERAAADKQIETHSQQSLLANKEPVMKAATFKNPDQNNNISTVKSVEQKTEFDAATVHAKKQKASKLKSENIKVQKDAVTKTKKHIRANTEKDNAEEASTVTPEKSAQPATENIANQQQGNMDNPNTPLDSSISGTKVVPTALPKQALMTDTTKTVLTKKKVSSNEKAILAGITGGVDYSTVRFTYADKPGYSIGAIAGYQFNKHWSFITGAIYTRKNYHLNGSDYHPPKHSMASYLNIQSVQGYCNMWEVPLLARYAFKKNSNDNYFISAGISSYFMKQQKYNYAYITNGVSYNGMYAYDSTYNHIFSILHLSAGIEKKLGKHTDLIIEPYAKIPLGGVGYGNIRLSSFGINFSIQLRQPLKH